MTLEAMQHHEAVTLHYGPTDYRRVGLVAALAQRIQGASVLDMRCLNGDMLRAASQPGRELFGLDGYQPAVDATHQVLRSVNCRTGAAYVWDLESLPNDIEESQFDCIVCADLLNHVPDDRETLKLIQRLLRPNGKLLLMVPAFPLLEGERDRSLGHLRRYTKRDIIQLLSNHGFSVRIVRPWNFLGLLPYIFVEKIFRVALSDSLRYSGAKRSSVILGPLLRWWYRRVESLFLFPIGLSYFVEAERII